MPENWTVEFWCDETGHSPLADWFASLQPVFQKRFAKLFGYLELLGNQLRLPHSRPLHDGLFELRDTGTGPGYRVYYCFRKNRVILLLFSGSKTSQEKDIKKALKIMGGLSDE